MANSVPELIEQIWTTHTAEIDGIKTTLPFEPGLVDRKDMPLLVMFFLLPEAIESETGDGNGPGEDNDWRWEISLYVTLDRYEDAQVAMRDMAQKVVNNFRQHRLDYDNYDGPEDVDLYARSLTRRIPPTPEDSDSPSYLRASWELKITGSMLDI